VNQKSRWINIPVSGDDECQGYLALPPSGSGPGLVVIQEIFGVNAYVRGVAEQFAAQGYVALAPDLFWRIKPRMEIGYQGAERVRANQIYDGLDMALALADVTATASYLRGRSEVRGKVGAVGFCLGGWLTYAAAAARAIDVGVSYYGGGIEGALHLADEIVAPMQFHFGEIDPHVPVRVASRLREKFAGRDAEVYTYPETDHGFNCWERETYHAASSSLAHERALHFLHEHR
jgi:carboxymethylenebutenolidase